jgi:hypothetical protein
MSLIAKTQFMLDKLFNMVMKMIPSASGKILYNKWVLYFIFILGIYDVIHFYQRGNVTAVAIFFIVGFLTSFFCKNMIVIIVSAIAVSHIVAYGNKMSEGFPILTTKKVAFKTMVTELLWFLKGDTNIKYLVDNDCHIWDGDCYQAYLREFEKYRKDNGLS